MSIIPHGPKTLNTIRKFDEEISLIKQEILASFDSVSLRYKEKRMGYKKNLLGKISVKSLINK